MFLLEAAPKDRRMLFASWQLEVETQQPPGRLDWLPLGGGAVPIELERLGLARSVRFWRPDRSGRNLYSPPTGRDPRKAAERTHARRNGDSFRCHSIQLAGRAVGLALISGGTITQYFLITMTPYAIRTLHLPPSSAMLGAITLGITGCLGSLAGGALADRWSIRPVVIASRIGLMIVLFPVMKCSSTILAPRLSFWRLRS